MFVCFSDIREIVHYDFVP